MLTGRNLLISITWKLVLFELYIKDPFFEVQKFYDFPLKNKFHDLENSYVIT